MGAISAAVVVPFSVLVLMRLDGGDAVMLLLLLFSGAEDMLVLLLLLVMKRRDDRAGFWDKRWDWGLEGWRGGGFLVGDRMAVTRRRVEGEWTRVGIGQ